MECPGATGEVWFDRMLAGCLGAKVDHFSMATVDQRGAKRLRENWLGEKGWEKGGICFVGII